MITLLDAMQIHFVVLQHNRVSITESVKSRLVAICGYDSWIL